MAIDAESGKSLLCMTRQYCRKINCARALRAIESPNRLWPMGVHIHSFRTITPARSHRDSGSYAFTFEFRLTSSRFSNTANSSVGNDTLNGRSVSMLHIGRNQFGNCLCQVHCLFFKTFANATLTSVDSWANPNLR